MLGSKKLRSAVDEKIIQPIQNAVIMAWAAIIIAFVALLAVAGSA
jgi:hypothetical protein